MATFAGPAHGMLPSDALKIVFVRTDRLGDVLLNLPAVAALREAYPESRITFLARPELVDLLSTVPEVDAVCSYQPGPRAGWWRRALRMGFAWRVAAYDVAIISNPMRELHLAAYLAGIPQRIGYDRKWGGLLTARLPDRKHLGLRHEVEANTELLKPLGIEGAVPAWRFPQLLQQQDEARALLQQAGLSASEPFIVVHPWTSNPAKQWPWDRFRQLIDRFIEQAGKPVVLIGGKAEAARLPRMLPLRPEVINLVGCLTLPQLAGLLQCAERLISNDSGPAHLAAAVGLPTIVLFGAAVEATGPRRWGPWGSGHVVIERSVITDITVEDVLEAIAQLSRIADAASTPSRR